MKLDLNTGGIISLEEAQAFINAFRKKYPNEIHSLFVGSNTIEGILEQEGCIGIRIYNGYNENEQRLNSVLVGVDNQGEDMRAIISDEMLPCPSNCPKKDLLDN